MLSFIVPAHNEETCLAHTLDAIHESARVVGQPYEIVVANDASTDATAKIARQKNALVVDVNHRQIAATRNSGGRAAKGDLLLFVDADTTINPRAVAAALRVVNKGAVGGGAPARFTNDAPLYAQILMWWLGWFGRLAGISGGAFIFCTRKAFETTGGFDERLFGAEDAAMSWALKREGRFVILWPYVLTSARRMRGIRGLKMMGTLFRMAFLPSTLKQRSRVEKIWYDSNRQDDEKPSDSLGIRALNGLLLLITLAWITGFLWNFIPESLTPRNTLLGRIRFGIAIFSCHIALVLWPCAYLIFRNLLKQNRWIERIKMVTLLIICLVGAWGATPVVIWFWPWLSRGVLARFS